MRVFLDECVDWRLSRDLAGHDVRSAVDRNLSFQQNLASYPIAVIVLCAHSNRLADLQLLVPDLLAAIDRAAAGQAELVGSA